jgi:hypothetical protein
MAASMQQWHCRVCKKHLTALHGAHLHGMLTTSDPVLHAGGIERASAQPTQQRDMARHGSQRLLIALGLLACLSYGADAGSEQQYAADADAAAAAAAAANATQASYSSHQEADAATESRYAFCSSVRTAYSEFRDGALSCGLARQCIQGGGVSR